MRRIVLLVAVAVVMAVMVALGAGTAFADGPVQPPCEFKPELKDVHGTPPGQANNPHAVCQRGFILV